MKLGKASDKEMVAAIAAKAGVTRVLAKQIYYALSEVIEEKLKEGKQIRIPYVGTFYFFERGAMKSNLTGERIAPHYQLKFRFRPDLPRYIRTMTREY